jgi:hypothetical protein
MYYPKSQIKTNLYSESNEYTLPNGDIYQGFYYKTSTGQYFTGKTPDDRPNVQIFPLVQFFNEPEIRYNISIPYNVDAEFDSPLVYEGGTPIDSSKVQIIPTYIPTTPTLQDYQIGEFRRYFCKKTNEIQYVEINKTQYDLLIVKSPDILWQLYFPFNLPWQITGDREQVARTNKNIVELTSQRLRLPKFGDYLNNNYLKYYR